MARMRRLAAALLAGLSVGAALAQTPPASSDRPWHGVEEQSIHTEAAEREKPLHAIDEKATYSLPDLIGFAEANNPDTREAWEHARAQAATLGVARSALYPTLAAAAMSGTDRAEIYFGTRYYRQTLQSFDLALELNYTIFDFGARAGRIDAAKADLLAANFPFNDVHRKLIYRVAEAYYELLNAEGQVDAAQANLKNAEAVQQAAQERLKNGLATMPKFSRTSSAWRRRWKGRSSSCTRSTTSP